MIKNLQPTWIYAAGAFDIVHGAHIDFLNRAKALGDNLIVGIISDEGIKEYKGHYPVMDWKTRAKVIENIKCVDSIIEQRWNDPTETFRALYRTGRRLNIRVCNNTDYGENGKHGKEVPGEECARELGIKTIAIPYTHGISSGMIKKNIIERLPKHYV